MLFSGFNSERKNFPSSLAYIPATLSVSYSVSPFSSLKKSFVTVIDFFPEFLLLHSKSSSYHFAVFPYSPPTFLRNRLRIYNIFNIPHFSNFTNFGNRLCYRFLLGRLTLFRYCCFPIFIISCLLSGTGRLCCR
mgnify:CR=1 FL=1